MCRSPKLFAAYRALHRLRVPRHPPLAFCRLTTFPTGQAPYARSCTVDRSDRSRRLPPTASRLAAGFDNAISSHPPRPRSPRRCTRFVSHSAQPNPSPGPVRLPCPSIVNQHRRVRRGSLVLYLLGGVSSSGLRRLSVPSLASASCVAISEGSASYPRPGAESSVCGEAPDGARTADPLTGPRCRGAP